MRGASRTFKVNVTGRNLRSQDRSQAGLLCAVPIGSRLRVLSLLFWRHKKMKTRGIKLLYYCNRRQCSQEEVEYADASEESGDVEYGVE